MVLNDNYITVVWFQVFLSNTNNFQTVLFDSLMEREQVLSLRVSVDIGVMAMQGYSIFFIFPELEPHYQMQFKLTAWTHRLEGITPLQGILSPHLTKHSILLNLVSKSRLQIILVNFLFTRCSELLSLSQIKLKK